MYTRISENSYPVVKNTYYNCYSFLFRIILTNYGLYFDEIIKLTTNKTQTPKIDEKFPQYVDDNLSSQMSSWCSPQNLFHSAFDQVHEHCHANIHNAQFEKIQYYQIRFLQK